MAQHTASVSGAAQAALPVIDLARADDAAQVEALRAELFAASHEVGFFYLVGHGIGPERQEQMFDVARRLFALPEAAKHEVEMLRSPHFRGWTRLGGELTRGRVDWREQIDVGIERPAIDVPADEPWYVLQGPNLWPAALADDLPVVQAWQRDLSQVGIRPLRLWATALGQRPDVWDDAFADRPAPLLKIVRYPASGTDTDTGTGTDTQGQGVGGHKDAGVLTLLLPEPGTRGLQVEHQGRWIDADPLPGAFIVNIGELLEVATGGLLKATEHRVLRPGDRERLSIPFFHAPGLSARFVPLELPPHLAELAARSGGVSEQAHNRLFDCYGANSLKSRLRAHPDVAAAHHPDLVGWQGPKQVTERADAAPDAGPDTGSDAGPGAGPDGGSDAGPDGGVGITGAIGSR
ncbi:isopenicillin N synthase family dioxygenase [Piscicoccus intestinalis]|uniref:isopenicillin N synthase family dioxygenase n=1 Tax=Piscicoccus intestinalis TaxID=746033 RepID=UPI000AFED379|nr:2-oxoglutarate and iron-dependent oxygenase domain-containing protein [Piscicoccus intestinalis]